MANVLVVIGAGQIWFMLHRMAEIRFDVWNLATVSIHWDMPKRSGLAAANMSW